MNKEVSFEDLGFRDYKAVWDYQEQRFQEILDIKISNRRQGVADPTPNYFLFVEHPHVYTLGKSGDEGNLLAVSGSLVLDVFGFVSLDGSFTYTPTPGFVGQDSFSYQASDGDLGSNAATVTIVGNATASGSQAFVARVGAG